MGRRLIPGFTADGSWELNRKDIEDPPAEIITIFLSLTKGAEGVL